MDIVHYTCINTLIILNAFNTQHVHVCSTNMYNCTHIRTCKYLEQSSIEVKDHDSAVRINHTNLTTLSWTIDTLLEENVTARVD